MTRNRPNILLFAAETLIVAPPLLLILCWVLFVLLGLAHIWDLRMHQADVGHWMTLVEIAALICFPMGVLLFVFAPKPRRLDD